MKKNKKRYYLKYTLLFVLFAGMIAYFYYSQGKSMAHYTTDGFRQHFRALVYISTYIKEILNNLFTNKTFVIPQWDFAIGEGSDLLEALHYYSLGDPIDLLSIVVPTNKMYLFYDFSIFLRMYISGIAFSELCFYTIKKDTGVGVICGTLLYSFSSYALCVSGTHIYFLNACMYLPLVLLGVEHVINTNKSILLSISVMLSAISNIYFFYMIVIATIIYTLIRIVLLQLTTKEKTTILLWIFVYSLIGVLLSGFIFLPMFKILLGNSRIVEGTKSNVLYSASYYLNNVKSFVYSNDYFGGYTILGLFSVILLFTKNNNRTLKILFIICTIFVCFPFFGKMFNGFSYTNERWLFIYSLLMCYIVTYSFENIIDSINSKKVLLSIVMILYTAVCIFINKIDWKIYTLLLILAFAIVITVNIIKNNNYKRVICLAGCLFSILFSIYFRYSNNYWGFGRNGSPIEAASNVASGEFNALDDMNDDSFYRYSGDSLTTNASIHGDKSTTGYYWSIANNNVIEFRKDIGLSDSSNHHYDSYNDSYILNSLASVKYYVKKDGDVVPYNYDYVGIHSGYELYRAKYTLPLVYAYDSYISEDEWNKLDLISKQETLTNNVVLKENSKSISNKNILINNQEINYELNEIKDVIISDNTINVLKNDGAFEIIAKCNDPGEYYFVINGINSNITTEFEIVLSNNSKKYLSFLDTSNPGYASHHNFAINLGYFDNFDEKIIVECPNVGSFSYENIKIIHLPLNVIEDNLRKLDSTNYEYINIGPNRIETKISLENNKILCFAIPYSDGWKAYVDGNEANIIKANIQYIGIEMNGGKHIIELKYSTPLLKAGCILSLFGIASLIALVVYNSKKAHKC